MKKQIIFQTGEPRQHLSYKATLKGKTLKITNLATGKKARVTLYYTYESVTRALVEAANMANYYNPEPDETQPEYYMNWLCSLQDDEREQPEAILKHRWAQCAVAKYELEPLGPAILEAGTDAANVEKYSAHFNQYLETECGLNPAEPLSAERREQLYAEFYGDWKELHERPNPEPKGQQQKGEIIAALNLIREGTRQLGNLYEANPLLNEIQPEWHTKFFAACLDDSFLILNSLIRDWAAIPAADLIKPEPPTAGELIIKLYEEYISLRHDNSMEDTPLIKQAEKFISINNPNYFN